MALKGYGSTHKRDLIEGDAHGQRGVSWPDPYYYAIHFATTLSAGVSSGGNTITVPVPMGVRDIVTGEGGNLIIEPETVLAEQHVVQSISGSGPYTITLVDTLTNSHAMDVWVAFDPGPNAEYINEHSGDNYSRATLTNDITSFPDPVDGVTNSGVQITWAIPSAPWEKATHVVEWDDPTAGDPYDIAVLNSFPVLSDTTTAPKIVVGNMINEVIIPS